MKAALSLTGKLRLYSSGNHEGANSLLTEILPKLRQIASRQISRKGRGRQSSYFGSLSPTELIGETWLLRLHKGRWTIDSREHFFALAGKAMESVLIDLARKRLAERRGKGAVHVSLEAMSPESQPIAVDAEQMIAIGMQLEKLSQADELTAYIVRQHYLVGFGLEEISQETGLTLRQVRHRWEKGRLLLAKRLGLHPTAAKLKKPLPEGR